METTLMALDTLATTFISIATMTNQTFPYVTIPDYGIHVAKSQPHTHALVTSFVAVVPAEDRMEWESYAALNNSKIELWLNNALHYQETYKQYYGPPQSSASWYAQDVIYEDFGPIPYNVSRPDRLDIFAPSWHSFPFVQGYGFSPANWGKFAKKRL